MAVPLCYEHHMAADIHLQYHCAQEQEYYIALYVANKLMVLRDTSEQWSLFTQVFTYTGAVA